MENAPISPRPRRSDRYRSEPEQQATPSQAVENLSPSTPVVQETPAIPETPAIQTSPVVQQQAQASPHFPDWYTQGVQQQAAQGMPRVPNAPSPAAGSAMPNASAMPSHSAILKGSAMANNPAIPTAPRQASPYQRPMAQSSIPPQGAQPVRPAASQQPTRQRAMPYPAQQQMPPMTPTRNAQPYSMQHAAARRSQPSPAPAPAPRRAPAAAAEAPEDTSRLPVWLTWSIVGVCLVLMALLAGHYMMQAYLTTRAQEWADAYQATLDNYHVIEQPNGQNTITYQALIERYATQYNLQPAFVTAIIRNESSFRTDAESSVGARGLMQLMPDTAAWIAGKLDDDSYSFDRMYDAETNIRYGCWYLNYLSRLFHGDAVLVSSAYHAGQTTVTRWLSDKSISSDGLTIPVERLPDGPTKQYAGRVTTSYGIYQALLYPSN